MEYETIKNIGLNKSERIDMHQGDASLDELEEEEIRPKR